MTSPSPQRPQPAGTQSLSRGIQLMRVIASRPGFGWRLSDLAAACGQDRATVHRMLACLVEQRLVEQRASDRHYLPGPLMFELGFALPERARFQRRVDTVVHTLARRMRGVALFLLRSGPEYVCTTRAGSLPLTGLMVYEGTRRPLFTSVGGVAILQTLAPPEMHAILEDNVAQEIARRGSGRLQALQAMRERSQQYGFGVNLGDVVPGIHAFATPVLDARGQAFAALCLTGTSEQYGQERVPALHQELAAASHTLQEDALKFNM